MSGITPHALGVHRVLGALKPALGPLLDWASRRRLERAVNISDLRDAAKLRAHKMVFDYLDAGADDEITIRRNKDAYSQHELHYRVLAGLAPPLDLSTRILDRRVEVPFFPAPTAGSKMFHADGEVGVARAAAAHGAMYCLSTMATSSPAEVAAAVPDQPKLFQLYVWKDRGLVRDMLAQAREHGFHALALTVDLTWYGNRERDVRNGFTVPPAYTLRQMFEAARRPAWSFDFLANPEYAYAALDVAAATRARRAAAAPPGAPPEPDFPADRRAQVSFIRDAFDPSFNWDDAEWLCQEWGDRGPVALKGVVRPSDAVKAVDRGFDAVWVSNHGGRQLETAPATVDVLSSVRAALGGAEEWAAAKACGGGGARRVGREGGERGSGGGGDRGDDGVDDRSSRLSRGFARLVVRGESRRRGGCRRGAVGGGEREDGFTRGGDRGRRGATRHGHPQTFGARCRRRRGGKTVPVRPVRGRRGRSA